MKREKGRNRKGKSAKGKEGGEERKEKEELMNEM